MGYDMDNVRVINENSQHYGMQGYITNKSGEKFERNGKEQRIPEDKVEVQLQDPNENPILFEKEELELYDSEDKEWKSFD